MSFGKAFETRTEAEAHAKKLREKNKIVEVTVRKMSKKIHPRRKKLFHVGSFTDFLNFA